MPEYRETEQSYLRRIIPDCKDLLDQVTFAASEPDPEKRHHLLALIYSNFQKIRDAVEAVEKIRDTVPNLETQTEPIKPTLEDEHPELPPFDSGYPEGWD